MLIHWLGKDDLETLVMLCHEEGWLSDFFEIERIMTRFPNLCFGAYDEGELIGAITGYVHASSAWMGNFIVKKSHRGKGIGKRLFEQLLRVLRCEREVVYLNAAPSMILFYERYGFCQTTRIGRYMNKGKIPPFNFMSAHAKELDRPNYVAIMKELDRDTFGEDRSTYLQEDMGHKTSLRFATENGFQHSRVMNAKYVFLGLWVVRSGAYDDAEKMLRGLLYYRGLKKIFADIPEEVTEIKELYEKYNFEKVGETMQMVRGTPLYVNQDNIYAYASTGVCG